MPGQYIDVLSGVLVQIDEWMPTLRTMAYTLAELLRRGRRLYVCGLGEHALLAQHFVSGLHGLMVGRQFTIAALDLCSNPALLTMAGSVGADQLFARQVRALGEHGDGLFVLAFNPQMTSLYYAIDAAQQQEMVVFGLFGSPALPTQHLDMSLTLPSTHVSIVQDVQQILCHLLCELVEQRLLSSPRNDSPSNPKSGRLRASSSRKRS